MISRVPAPVFYFTYVYILSILGSCRVNTCEPLFHSSPGFVRPLRVVFLSVNDANATELVIVGITFLHALRVQVLRPASVLREEEGGRAVAAVFLNGTIELEVINLVALRLRPCQEDFFVLRQL